MASDELARLRAEVDRLLTERAEMARSVRDQVATERARLKAKAEQIQMRTRPLLQQARRELERLGGMRVEDERVRAALERRAKDAETRARRLSTENERLKKELDATRAKASDSKRRATKKAKAAIKEAKAAAKAAEAAAEQAEAKAVQAQAAADQADAKAQQAEAKAKQAAALPRAQRPPRPAFMRSTQIISTGSANAVWQDNAKAVTETRRSKDDPGKAGGVRRAMRPEDLESREEPIGFEGVGGIESTVGLDSLSDLDQIDDDSISDIDLMGLLDESD